MQYTRSIYFKDGQNLTITEIESEAIKERIKAGDKFIEVQRNFISVDNIARIGQHSSTAQIKKLQEADEDMKLMLSGNYALLEKKRRLKEQKSIEHCQKEEFPPLLESPEEDKGSPDFYLDKETGEKVYS